MKLEHPNFTSDFFDLVRVSEFDLTIEEQKASIRIEIMQSVDDERRFRARMWVIDQFRMTPTNPQDDAGEPTEMTDDPVMVERSSELHKSYASYEARGIDDAMRMVLIDLARRLEYWTKQPAKLVISARDRKRTWF